MRKLIRIIMVVFLVSSCSTNSLSQRERDELSAKKNKAFGEYTIKVKNKAIKLVKEQEAKLKSEKIKIDLMIADLEEKLDRDDFSDNLSTEIQTYSNTIKDLREHQIKELQEYLRNAVEPLEKQHLKIQTEKEEEFAQLEEEVNKVEEDLVDETSESESEISSSENPASSETVNEPSPTYVKGILIVNKKHPLPSNYNPGEDEEASQQIRTMISDMQSSGYAISSSYSGFRSYSHQKDLYERYVNQDGKALADTYSARPGHSEHQTGLTFDLLHSDGSLVETENEVRWISNNASNYGFIVRYQQGKENITGYQAEPWHLRYIGDEAFDIVNSGLTLEEYLGVAGGDY